MSIYSARMRTFHAATGVMLVALGVGSSYWGAGKWGFVTAGVAAAALPRIIWPVEGRATDPGNGKRWAIRTLLTTFVPETVAVLVLGFFVTWVPALVYLGILAVCALYAVVLLAGFRRRRREAV